MHASYPDAYSYAVIFLFSFVFHFFIKTLRALHEKQRKNKVKPYCNLQILCLGFVFGIFWLSMALSKLKGHLNAKNTCSDHDSIHRR